MDQINNYMNKDQHVDTSINANAFLSSARCVIYAASGTGGVSSNGRTSFRPIGVIQSFVHAENREVERIFELGSDVPYLVPGRTVGSLELTRVMISGKDLLNVLYGNDKASDPANWMRSIKDISKPLDLLFVAYTNTNNADAKPQMFYRQFTNCVITARQEQIAAGTITITEGISIYYEKIGDVKIYQS